jgi:hypothetical protein
MEAEAVKKAVCWTLVCLMALSLAAPAAQGEGWSLKKLNPFAKSTASSKKKKSSGLTSWKMPKLRTPAPIQKVNQSTTRMASKTWDTLTFWDNEPAPSKNAWGSGAKPYKRKTEEKESWLGSLFSTKDEKPKDPNDFLRQKRPE